MYRTFTSNRFAALAVTAIASLMFIGSALAGPPAGKFKPGKPGGKNIVATAAELSGMMNDDQGVPEFTYLLAAVGCLEGNELDTVVGILTGSDNYTLFAPVNDAFRALQGALGIPEDQQTPEATCLVDDPSVLGPGTLFTVLAYHVTEGRRFSNSVFNKNETKEIEMLAAGSIYAAPNFTLIDGFPATVPVLIPNVSASNGAIHAIGGVLLPFNPLAP